MLATGIVCFALGVMVTLAVRGLTAWGRLRGRALSVRDWALCAGWALVAFAAVLFPTISLGEGETQAALYGAAAGAPLLLVASALLWRLALRRR